LAKIRHANFHEIGKVLLLVGPGALIAKQARQ
jgi:hypothetical protein